MKQQLLTTYLLWIMRFPDLIFSLSLYDGHLFSLYMVLIWLHQPIAPSFTCLLYPFVTKTNVVFFVQHSTNLYISLFISGYYAWRRRTGAWFIQSLCMILSHSGLGAMSFLKALVLVSKNVAFNYTSDNPAKPSMDAKKVVPVIQSMLVKDIFMTAKKLK